MFASFIFLMTINPLLASEETSQRIELAKRVIDQAQRNDTDYGCKPISWFSGFSSDTRMAITRNLVVFYEADDWDHSFQKLYHMFTRESESRGKITGSGYFPGLGRNLGTYVLQEFGMSCCDLTVIMGKPKQTEFNCGWDTMIN